MAGEGEIAKAAKRFTGWTIVAGVLFILLGVFAVAEPAVAGLGVAIFVGWVLVIGAVAHLVATFEGGGAGHVLFHVLAAVVFGIGGWYMLSHPLLALGTLTLLLGAVIFAFGVFEVVSYFRLRGRHASGWLLFNGIIALLLGGMIWLHWPSSAVWAIGTLVGVNLLFTGMTRVSLGLAARRLMRDAR